MTEQGVVKELKGQFAVVQMQKHAACAGCNACKKGSSDNDIFIEAENPINASVGDKVEVDLEAPNLLTAAIIVYMIPLLALLIGVFIGYKMGSDMMSAILGVVFMAATFGMIKLKDKVMKDSKKFTPVITKKVIEL